MKKTIITAALTGSVAPMGYDIPTTPEQIAEDAYACWKQGAAIVHLHMRDSTGAETADPAMFAKTIRLIRERRDCDVIIDCASSCGPAPPGTAGSGTGWQGCRKRQNSGRLQACRYQRCEPPA